MQDSSFGDSERDYDLCDEIKQHFAGNPATLFLPDSTMRAEVNLKASSHKYAR